MDDPDSKPGNQLPVVADWFSVTEMVPGLIRIREPHVKPLLAANMWVIQGRQHDLWVDSGNGVAPLRRHIPQLFEREPSLVVTHGHPDHLGGAHEFSEVWAHRSERVQRNGRGSLDPNDLAEVMGVPRHSLGSEVLIDAIPDAGFDWRRYELKGVTPTREISDGDRLDIGDFAFEVLHLPGHTPGSVGLYEPERRLLFTGDVVYADSADMIDYLAESSPTDYATSMKRLLGLEVDMVLTGHGEPFGKERLVELGERYLSLPTGHSRPPRHRN